MLVVLLFVIGAFGIGFAAVVYRADPTRHDNRLFAVVGAIDAVTAFARALLVWQGHQLSDLIVTRVNTVLQALIAAVIIAFAWSFPFSRKLPRWALVLDVVAFFTVVPFVVADAAIGRWVSVTYFLPTMFVTIWLLVRQYRRVTGADVVAVRMVMIALILRWLAAHFCYEIAYSFGPKVFEAALTCEATAAVLASQVLIGYAVLFGHLFRVRGFLAEVLVVGSFALAVIAATAAAIEAALAWSPSPFTLRLFLFAAALIPLHMFAIGRHFRARLESALLGPLDPRRAARENCMEQYMRRAERADPAGLIAASRDTIAAITVGGKARFLAAPGRPVDGADGTLDDGLGDIARSTLNAVHGPQLPRGVSLLVPLRVDGELAGALAVEGGQIDRDSVMTAITIAKHVGLRLENFALATQLEESKRLAALGSFAAAIAHDIRTPLTSVQMNVQILRGKAKLPPDDMEHFDIALDELRRLNGHISELLDYAKPVRLAATAIEPRELADEAARTIAPVLAERDIRLDVESDGAPTIVADGTRLRQVLLNLLDNAARASTRGSAVVLRTAAAPDGRAVFEVEDRGKGIDAGDLARIFEPFYTTRPDGTGLGLAIVQKLVRAHHGEVTVRSAPGQGATFTVLLPSGHVT